MRLGVNVPNFGPGTGPESLAGWVRFAEDAGFSLAMVSDHVAVTPDVAELYPPPFYDPSTTLAWLAAITDRIGLGISVTILPYRPLDRIVDETRDVAASHRRGDQVVVPMHAIVAVAVA